MFSRRCCSICDMDTMPKSGLMKLGFDQPHLTPWLDFDDTKNDSVLATHMLMNLQSQHFSVAVIDRATEQPDDDYDFTLYDDEPERQFELVEQMVKWVLSYYVEGDTVPVIVRAPTHGTLSRLIVALQDYDISVGVILLSDPRNLRYSMMDLNPLFGPRRVIHGRHFIVDINRFNFIQGNQMVEDAFGNLADLLSLYREDHEWRQNHPEIYQKVTTQALANNVNLIQPENLFADNIIPDLKTAPSAHDRSATFQYLKEILHHISIDQVRHQDTGEKMDLNEDKEMYFAALAQESNVLLNQALMKGGWRPCIKPDKARFLNMYSTQSEDEALPVELFVPLNQVYIPLALNMMIHHPCLIEVQSGGWNVSLKNDTGVNHFSSCLDSNNAINAYQPQLRLGCMTKGELFNLTMGTMRHVLTRNILY